MGKEQDAERWSRWDSHEVAQCVKTFDAKPNNLSEGIVLWLSHVCCVIYVSHTHTNTHTI